MGLDFSHSNVNWSYSGFARFRRKLANSIGVDLDKMDGFGGEISWDTVSSDLKIFIDHSDCDGELSPEECGKIAPIMKQIVSLWKGDFTFDREKGLELADDLQRCANEGITLVFE